MTDINRRLQHNSTNQKQAKQAVEFLELDRQGKEIEEKGQVRTFFKKFVCCLCYFCFAPNRRGDKF